MSFENVKKCFFRNFLWWMFLNQAMRSLVPIGGTWFVLYLDVNKCLDSNSFIFVQKIYEKVVHLGDWGFD